MTDTTTRPHLPAVPPSGPADLTIQAPARNGASRFDLWSDPALLLIAGAVLAAASLAPTVGRSVVTLPLVLILPGHALLAALNRPDRTLSASGRFAIRVALSLAVVALVVLLVGWLFSVERPAVVTGLWLANSASAFAAWRHPLPRRSAVAASPFTQSGVLLGLAALLTVGAVAVGVILLPEPRVTPYSRLSLDGPSRDVDSPVVVTKDADPEIRVEVENGTGETVSYRVIPSIDGGFNWDSPKAVVKAGETWSGTITGPLPADACEVRLRVALSADGKESGVAPLVLYIRNERGEACR